MKNKRKYNFVTPERHRGALRDKSAYIFYLKFISTGIVGPEGSSVLAVVNTLLYINTLRTGDADLRF